MKIHPIAALVVVLLVFFAVNAVSQPATTPTNVITLAKYQTNNGEPYTTQVEVLFFRKENVVCFMSYHSYALSCMPLSETTIDPTIYTRVNP